ncbi:MAG: glycosyltransferase [Nocardioidaceae bacterium]|nr:glycosyltransferase [Nocardioidaceae bacterium]
MNMGPSSDRAHGCEVVIPCRDEALALPSVLAALPDGFHAIVVDNGSRDGTAVVAAQLGATVVHESLAGYGAAVHTGVLAAKADYLAVVDGDDSMSLADLPRLLALVSSGEATMAIGRRRPIHRGVWPWHARLGTSFLAWILRRRSDLPIHDLAPMRVCRRQDLLDLDVQDRRFGYPLELMIKAGAAGWTVREIDIDYRPRAAGTKSKVSGSSRGTLRVIRDFAKVMR